MGNPRAHFLELAPQNMRHTRQKLPPLGIAPRLSAPQAEVLLLYYSGNDRSPRGAHTKRGGYLADEVGGKNRLLPPLGIAPRLTASQAAVLLLHHGGDRAMAGRGPSKGVKRILRQKHALAGNQTRVSSVAGTYTITVLPARN